MTTQPELPFGEGRLALTAPSPTPRETVAGAAHSLTAGAYSAIARRLFDEILELQTEDPLRRVEVLLPSHLLGVDLRRRLLAHLEASGSRAAFANVHFTTPSDVARLLLEGRSAGRPAPPSLLFAAVASALETLVPASPYFESRHRVGFVAALTATLRDLRDAGVGGEAIAAWAERAAPDRREHLRALAGIALDVGKRLAPFADDVALFSAAIRATRKRRSKEPLLVFGFYDLTGLQRDLLAALGASRPLHVFLPRFDGDLGDYAADAETFFREALGVETEAAPAAIAGTKSEFVRRFAGREGGPALEHDGSVRLVSAADDAHEAREAAREILIAASEGHPLASSAVLVRSAGEDSRRILAELTRAGVPAFTLGAEDALASPVGRTIRLWSLLEEDGYRREDVLELLELLEDSRGGTDAAVFRLLAAETGVVRGVDDWNSAVARLSSARLEEADEEERASGLAARRPEGLRAAGRLGELWPAVLSSSRFSTDEKSRGWSDWAADLRDRLARLYGSASAIPDEIGAALEAMEALEATGGRVKLKVAVQTLISELRESAALRGRLGRDGVAVLPVMAARGLAFSHTVVAGLAERKFPALPRPDPLLFDDERSALAAETGRPLAPKAARRPEEERFLLAAALDTASRRLTLTASRRDAVLDRERVPSQFFDRAVEALGGAGSHVAFRRTDLGSTPLEGPARTVSEARQRLLQTGGRVRLAEVVPAFAHALSRMQSRDRRVFGPFEGRIEDLSLREALARRVVERGLSASALQTFAVCPHRFFLGRLLGLRAWEDPSERGDVDDLTRGQLYHDAARRVADAWRGRPFGELSGKAERPIVTSAAAGALSAYEEEAGFRISPPVLREIVLRRLEGQLSAWLAGERSDAPDLRPIGAEVRFGPDAPGAEEEDSELSTDRPLDVAGLALRGRVDLLATDGARGRLRVTDFKAPRTRNRAETIRKLSDSGRRIFGGELAQLPVYAAACAGPLAKKGKLPGVASVEYQFIAPERTGGTCGSCRVAFSGSDLAQSVEGLAAFTVGALEAVSEGVLIPKTRGVISDDHCKFCDFDDVCGEGHVRPFQEKAAHDRDPAVVAFFELEEIP